MINQRSVGTDVTIVFVYFLQIWDQKDEDFYAIEGKNQEIQNNSLIRVTKKGEQKVSEGKPSVKVYEFK